MFSLFRRFHCHAVIWLGTVLCCTASDRQTLRVCADPNNLPFSNRMGQGLENKLAHIIAQNLSVELKYVWFSERKNFLENSLNANYAMRFSVFPSIWMRHFLLGHITVRPT
jgi:hypothetical protein